MENKECYTTQKSIINTKVIRIVLILLVISSVFSVALYFLFGTTFVLIGLGFIAVCGIILIGFEIDDSRIEISFIEDMLIIKRGKKVSQKINVKTSNFYPQVTRKYFVGIPYKIKLNFIVVYSNSREKTIDCTYIGIKNFSKIVSRLEAYKYQKLLQNGAGRQQKIPIATKKFHLEKIGMEQEMRTPLKTTFAILSIVTMSSAIFYLFDIYRWSVIGFILLAVMADTVLCLTYAELKQHEKHTPYQIIVKDNELIIDNRTYKYEDIILFQASPIKDVKRKKTRKFQISTIDGTDAYILGYQSTHKNPNLVFKEYTTFISLLPPIFAYRPGVFEFDLELM